MTAVHTVAGLGQSWQVQSTGTGSGWGGVGRGWGGGGVGQGVGEVGRRGTGQEGGARGQERMGEDRGK